VEWGGGLSGSFVFLVFPSTVIWGWDFGFFLRVCFVGFLADRGPSRWFSAFSGLSFHLWFEVFLVPVRFVPFFFWAWGLSSCGGAGVGVTLFLFFFFFLLLLFHLPGKGGGGVSSFPDFFSVLLGLSSPGGGQGGGGSPKFLFWFGGFSWGFFV